MSQKLVHGYAWYTYPDVFGLDASDATDPGHPFAIGAGQVRAPADVLFFRPVRPTDTGIRNEQRDHAYLVLTKTPLHPQVSKGWESDPALLTEKFKSEDSKAKMVRIVELHHRRAGDIMECELKVEESVT
jgi:hypothetical protein